MTKREPITTAKHEAIWEAYRGGNRKPTLLARQFGVGYAAVKRLIERGDPSMGWRPFRERLITFEHDQQVLRDQQTLEAGRRHQEELVKARSAALQLSNAAKQIAARTMKCFAAAADSMTFDRERRVKVVNDDGTTHWEYRKLPPSGLEVAEAFSKIVEGLKWLVEADNATVDETSRKETARSLATQVVRAQITPEQLDHIAKTGELPPGVTEADLLNLDPATMSDRSN